jgi:type I restriction enzyme S subunit
MGEWKTTTIGEIAEVYDGPHATPPKTQSGPWFLSISSLDNGRLNLAASAHISEADFERWTRRVTPREGDVLFSYETRLGEAALMPAGLRACLGRRMGLLRPKPDRVDSRFLLYAYLGPEFQEVIRQRAVHGATVDRIPLAELPNWPISIPSLREQRAIAAVLGALDDKIAVNERIATTVDRLAEAEYVKSTRTAMETVALKDLLDLKYGKSLPATRRSPGDVPVYGSGGIVGMHNQHLVDGPGIVVGRKGTVGTIHWSRKKFFPIDTTFYVEVRRPEVPIEFLFFMLRKLGLDSMNSDSAVPGLNRAHTLALRIQLPQQEELARFAVKIRPLFELKHSLSVQSNCLKELRDTLLPKLMSGELRVRDR